MSTQFETFVDIHKSKRRRKPEFELQTFYGRLEYIFVLRLDTPQAMTAFNLDAPTTIVLAAIRTCAITSSNHRLDIHYYSQYGSLSVVDIQCIQCLVGRVPDSAGGGWGIVDRSGTLARALAVDDM